MTKLIIQIPCYNEEKTLGITLSALPGNIPGVDVIEFLIIDDGSTDNTVNVAEQYGVHHIVSHSQNMGLSRAFMTGLDAALKAGADIIVNTDADNQYNAGDIPRLIAPILEKKADIVIGARPISEITHFSRTKKFLQKMGSWVIRAASKTDVLDASSGFRAISRDAARQLNVFNEYTYTLETIVQAGQKGMAVRSVPIRTNEDLRPSRLIKGIPSYIAQSILTIVRIFMAYRPFSFFSIPGVISFGLGILIGLRFMYFYLISTGRGHVQSVILAALLLGTGFFLVVVGLLADLISVNRKLLEKLNWRVQQIEENMGKNKQSAVVTKGSFLDSKNGSD